MNETTLQEKLLKIRCLVMDIDGTMTDSGVYYSADGEQLKRFSIRDGMGINLWHRAGHISAILTSESSPIVTARAKKLTIQHVLLGSRHKTESVRNLAKELRIDMSEIAYIGDDINDLQAMSLVGVSACPSDAVQSIKDVATFNLSVMGGHGAVREFVEIILIAQNKPITLPDSW